jgi:hypothetical protein
MDQGQSERDFHEEFRKKRKSFRLLTAALLVLIVVRYFTKPLEAAPFSGADDLIFIGGLVMIAIYSWLVFRCPNCRATLPQTFALPGKKERKCPGCGVRLGE